MPDLRDVQQASGSVGLTTEVADSTRPVTVALDLLGGDGAPGVVADAALLVAREQPDVDLILVGTPNLAERIPVGASHFAFVAADGFVAMNEDPARAVRSRPLVSVRVAADLVRDGKADACVSMGHTGAALAAAVLRIGRLPGIKRPAVAVVIPCPRGNVVMLDAGGTTECTTEMLVQFALSGTAFAAALGIRDPRVGLLTIGSEPGKGDTLRRRAHAALEKVPIDYVGGVEGEAVSVGGLCDVVVTDGFTGNVVLKAIEGTAAVTAERLARVYNDPRPAREMAAALTEQHSGAVLLGVQGVSVVGHGNATARGVAACVALAARAVREELVPRTSRLIGDLDRRWRRSSR